MHVTIATPMYGGQCSGVFTKSLLSAFLELPKSGIEVAFIDLYNESLITRARNTISKMFLNSSSDYLLFIDADQSFRSEDIIRMLAADKDIIGAPVPMKGINWEHIKKAALEGKDNLADFSGIFNVNFLPGFIESGAKIKVSEPAEVMHIGTGMMLIKRSVLEQLSDTVEEYVYNGSPIVRANITPGETLIKNFWETKIVDNTLLSEDYNFCSIWRSQGGKIYVDLLAKVIHMGTYPFSGNIFDKDALKKAEAS